LGDQLHKTAAGYMIHEVGAPAIKSLPKKIIRASKSAQRQHFHASENHQKLFGALPWSTCSCISGLFSGMLYTAKTDRPILQYVTAGIATAFSLFSLYKAITTYRSITPIHPDTTPAVISCESPFVALLAKNLQDQQLVLAIESQSSFYLANPNKHTRQNFVRYLASQSGLPIFIIHAQDLLDNPSEIDRLINRANLAAQACEHTGALIYIEAFELLNNPEHHEVATHLSECIYNQTRAAFQKIKTIMHIKQQKRYAQQNQLVEEIQESAIESLQSAQIFFIAGMNDENTIQEPFKSKNQFKTTLELKTLSMPRVEDGESAEGGAGPADELETVTCCQQGQSLSFDPLQQYLTFYSTRHLNFYEQEPTAHTIAQEYLAYREQSKKAMRVSSSQTVATIPGGYPHEIDTIVHSIKMCIQNKQLPSLHGILLYGPAGCGKTYLARSLAGTLDVPFFTAKIADILSDRQNASSIMTARFSEAQKAAESENSIAILFIDECDELLQTHERAPDYIAPIAFNLRSILNGFDVLYNRVILIVATNTPPEGLDQTLVRSGRFNYKIHINYPSHQARAAIFIHHLSEKHLDHNEELIAMLVDRTNNWSASDIATLVEKTAAETAAHGKPPIPTLIEELERMKEHQRTRENATQTERAKASWWPW